MANKLCQRWGNLVESYASFMKQDFAAEKERLKRERKFHDDWALSIDLDELMVRENFESPTAIENRYALSELGPLKGKKILDLGCGSGETSVYFGLLGAKVFSSDISGGFLNVAKTLAEKFGTELNPVQTDAGKLPFRDNSFDFVFGNGVLHHVDLEKTAPEIRRVLKPGGRAAFIEPLPYNPVINVYRRMAEAVRTEDEKPLTLSQIKSLSQYFSSLHHQEFWFFSLLIFLHFFFIRRWHPSKVRYWKKVIEVGESYRRPFSVLQGLDHFFLKYFPFLRPFCWNTVIIAEKG